MNKIKLTDKEAFDLIAAHAVPGLHGYSADAMMSAVLEEREACAKVCDEQAGEPECSERAKYCAEEIRSRSNTK